MTSLAIVPSVIRPSTFQRINEPISHEGWDSGLPRTINPNTGKDDTEARKLQCEEAYKVRHYNTQDQVDHLRRTLYLSIVFLRTKTSVGYSLDYAQEKMATRPPILQ